MLAQFVIAGFISGSTIESNEIISSSINNGNGTFSVDENGILSATKGRIGCDKDGNGGFIIDADKLYSGKESISSGKNGVYLGTDGIALGVNSTFKVDSLGNLTAASADITGRITANEGYIGGTNGFTIQAGKMYSGKSSASDSNAGIYLGTDGIALGANSVFKVTNDGVLTATSGYIGGAKIMGNALRSDNGNWSVNSDGTALFKNVAVTGGSSSLNIGGDFYLFGNALNDFNELVANKVTANYVNVTLGLESKYAKISELDAVSIRVGNLEGNHVSANDFDAVKADIRNLNASNITTGTLSVDRLNIEGIVREMKSYTLQCINFTAQTIRGSGFELYEGETGYVHLSLKTINIGGNTYKLLGA